MKTCSICAKSKEICEFNKKGKNRQSCCKDCQKGYYKKWYSKNKELVKKRCSKNRNKHKKEIIKYLGEILTKAKCELCNNSDFYCLEFDHFKDKKNNISTLLSNKYTLNTIKKEIAKCRILCSNCHRKFTHITTNSWRHQYMVGFKGI